MRITLALALLIACAGARAQTDKTVEALVQKVEALTKTMEQLNGRIETLEAENKTLKEGQETIQQDVAAIPPPAAPAAPSLNPDIGVVFDVVGNLTEDRPDDAREDEGFDRFSVREIELNIGHDIDPYARLDATITFSDFEDVDIEEAYASYSELPLDLWGRVGRFRLPIGLSNPKHRDQLFTVDEPLMIRRYLGAEGLFRTGVEFSRFLPQFNDKLTQQVRWGLSEGGSGEGGTLFGESRQHPTYFARLRNELALSQNDSLSLGSTFLAGSGDAFNNEADVLGWGFDAEYQHKFGQYRALTLQAESLLQDRDHGITPYAETQLWGYYLLANFRATQRWSFGTRYDYAEVADYDPFALTGTDPENYPYNVFRPNPNDDETSVSAWITFHQSEFAQWRLQYDHLDYANGLDDDQLRLQATFSVGWHQHAIK